VEKHESDPARTSTVPQVAPVHPRKLAKVPFLELTDGRLQGVVSSGSDIERVLAEAEKQFGASQVARYLSIEVAEGEPLFGGLHPTSAPGHAAEVFSSFLRHLAYLEVPVSTEPLPELQWFPAGPVQP
jgi:hypothetical protein